MFFVGVHFVKLILSYSDGNVYVKTFRIPTYHSVEKIKTVGVSKIKQELKQFFFQI